MKEKLADILFGSHWLNRALVTGWCAFLFALGVKVHALLVAVVICIVPTVLAQFSFERWLYWRDQAWKAQDALARVSAATTHNVRGSHDN